MTTLIIARHGNTFEDGETPRRVGRRTNPPLTEKGRAQARALGAYLQTHNLTPDAVFCGTLRRTLETARLAAKAPLQTDAMFDEIDYGPDENRTEDEVIARLGEKAIKDWDENAAVPPGWIADPHGIVTSWLVFGARLVRDFPQGRVLAVTSNGIARFAPHLTGDFAGFKKDHKLKIATGALCVLRFSGGAWRVEDWNVKP